MSPRAKKAAGAGGGGRRDAAPATPTAAAPAAASPPRWPQGAANLAAGGVPSPDTPVLHGVQTNYSDVLKSSSKNRGDAAFLHSVDEALRRILRHPYMADIRQAKPRGVDTGHGGQVVHTHMHA